MLCPNQIVYVRWKDALQHDEVQEGKDGMGIPEPITSHILGFLLKSDKDGVVIAQEWLPSAPSFKNVTAIPRGMVVTEVVLSQAPEWPVEDGK